MHEMTRPQLAVYAAAAVAIALVGARYLRDAPAHGGGGAAAPAPAVRVQRAGGGRAVVQVAGAVRRAGGATRRADLTAVNLAARVEDGRQVIVPRRGAAGAAAAAPAAGGVAGAAAPGQPLNLNTATAEQLDTLDGIGPAMAAKILAYRQAHGGFRSVDELDEIPGIGEKRMAALRPLVRV